VCTQEITLERESGADELENVIHVLNPSCFARIFSFAKNDGTFFFLEKQISLTK
jgi:hypothetical protein